MKTKIGKILLTTLKTYLIISGILLPVGIAYAAYNIFFAEGIKDGKDIATPKEVQFVLDESGLKNCKIVEVTHSEVTPVTFTGDRLTVLAIKVEGLTEANFTSTPKKNVQWHRGDQLPPILQAGMGFIEGHRWSTPWLPSEAELTSKNWYFQLHYFRMIGGQVGYLIVTFVNPSTGMVYFFESKV